MADEEQRPESDSAAEAPTPESGAEDSTLDQTSPENSAQDQHEAITQAVAVPHHHDAGHGHGHGDEHFAHELPMSLLVGVLLALILLTVLTVGVTSVDLGSQGNFVVAMIIATVKAVLVMGYFMHMVWDSKFNVVAFTSSFLFVLLFLAMAVLDRSEYQDSIDLWETDQKIEAAQ